MNYTKLCVLMLSFFLTLSSSSKATPIRGLPNLQGLRVYERTSGLQDIFYSPNAPDLVRITDLTASADFFGTGDERYDIFYSDQDGTPNLDGSWVTIDALFPPDAGGHNITDVQLEFSNSGSEFADRWSREIGFGSSYSAGSVLNAIDGDLDTHTTLGTSSDNNNRLSITIGFASSIPEPTSLALCTLLACGSFLAREKNSIS